MNETLSLVADIIGVLGAIFAGVAWWNTQKLREIEKQERLRQKQHIRVMLHHGTEKIELPVAITRSELTRAELLGRIGMIPLKQREKFSIKYFNNPDFFRKLDNAKQGNGNDSIVIPVSQDEFTQFDLPETVQVS